MLINLTRKIIQITYLIMYVIIQMNLFKTSAMGLPRLILRTYWSLYNHVGRCAIIILFYKRNMHNIR